MARLKAKVVYAQHGYVATVTQANGTVWYRIYDSHVSQMKVISDFKADRLCKLFKKR